MPLLNEAMIDDALNVNGLNFTFVPWEDDTVEDQLVVSEQEFEASLSEDQMAADFSLLQSMTSSVYHEDLMWHSTQLMGHKNRLRARYMAMMDAINAKLRNPKRDSNNNPGGQKQGSSKRPRRFIRPVGAGHGRKVINRRSPRSAGHLKSHVAIRMPENAKGLATTDRRAKRVCTWVTSVSVFVVWLVMMTCFAIASRYASLHRHLHGQ